MENILVSIGVPVFNGEKFIGKTLASIINQSYKNLEIIISDNNSSDKTPHICKKYCKQDKRIKYFRQKKFLNIAENFHFVLKKAKGEFFTWNSINDYKSKDFIEVNLSFLIKNKKYIASTSRNSFGTNSKIIDFELEGSLENRIETFFKNCWSSHAIFYALIRTNHLKKCPFLGESFFACDWVIDIFLIKYGPIKRLNKGSIFVDDKGISNSNQLKNIFVYSFLDKIFPFRKLFFFTINCLDTCSFSFKLKIIKRMLYLNYIFAKHIFFMK